MNLQELLKQCREEKKELEAEEQTLLEQIEFEKSDIYDINDYMRVAYRDDSCNPFGIAVNVLPFLQEEWCGKHKLVALLNKTEAQELIDKLQTLINRID